MSLLYGILYQSGRSVEPAVVDSMYSSISHFPHVQHRQFLEENYAVGHLLTYNTPEAIFEKQPIDHQLSGIVFCFQGRLDYRRDLAKELGIEKPESIGDDIIALNAYLKWGEKTPNYLRGSWSFAAYNKVERQLFLARDTLGNTALYYFLHKDFFAFANSQKCILSLKQFEQEIALEYILRGIVLAFNDEYQEQAYKNLMLLPPGHCLLLKNGQIHLKRYWFPEEIEERPFSAKANYAEELKEVFERAVYNCMRSYKPIASMLSGGLDSSSVSVLAADLLRRENKYLRTYSHVPLYKDSLAKLNIKDRLLDESPYINAIVAKSGNIDPFFIDSAEISPLEGINKMLEIVDSPLHAASNAFWSYSLFERAYKDGYGTLLSGEHGNATISFNGVNHLLPLKYRWRNKDGLLPIVKSVLKPYIIHNNLYLEYFDKTRNYWKHYNDNNLLRTKVLNSDLYKTLYTESISRTQAYKTKQEAIYDILKPFNSIRSAPGSAIGHFFGIDFRDPTADLDLFNYCLSLPNEVFFENGQGRYLIKKTMKAYLPMEVLTATRKGLQSADISLRVKSSAYEFEAVFKLMKKNNRVDELLDIESIIHRWQYILKSETIDISKVQYFLKMIMVAGFLIKEKRC